VKPVSGRPIGRLIALLLVSFLALQLYFVARIVFMRFDGKGAGVKSAVGRPRAERHEHPSVELERGNLVADAFLGFGRRGLDGSSKLLERSALIGAQGREVLVDVSRLSCHDSRSLLSADCTRTTPTKSDLRGWRRSG
jgi:hypothetical protein